MLQIYRVFYDRLVDDSDRKWLHEFVTKVTKEVLGEDYVDIFSRLLATPNSKIITEDDMRSLMFCDFQVFFFGKIVASVNDYDGNKILIVI